MELKCVRKCEGFTVGKKYNLIACAGEHIEILDDNREQVIVYESYFDLVEFNILESKFTKHANSDLIFHILKKYMKK